MNITEDNLVHMMNPLKEKDGKVTLFMTKKKVQIVHMPQLLEMIKEIGTNIETVEGWTDPGARRPLAPQPPVDIRRPSPPRRNEAPPRENSSRKLMQCFTFQFRSLLRIVDGEAGMDSATTDQAESMYKTLETMRQSLDKYDDIDVENITIDGL